MGLFAGELRAGIGEAARKMTEARLAGDHFSAEAYRGGCVTCGASPPATVSGHPPSPRTPARPARACGEDAAAPAPGRCRLRSVERADAVTAKRAGVPPVNAAGEWRRCHRQDAGELARREIM